MKKISLYLLLVVATMFVGCSTTVPVVAPSAKLINTATYTRGSAVQPVSAVFADLQVSPEKILFLYIPSNTVLQGGESNVVSSAVREALLSNGNADVLVALESQIKYGEDGKIESITVTGYPAKYVNFRNPGDEYLRDVSKSSFNPVAKPTPGKNR